MYDNLSSRLRGEAEASDASPYIKELMKQAADALDHFENLARTLQSLSAAPTIIPPHGRLIEESKVLDIVFEWCPDDDGSVGKVGDLREMLDEIEELPTIIPASEEGET